jgi:hypothetical protein
MALRVTISKGVGDYDHFYTATFDVDLIDYDEMEFVDDDIEAMEAAEALGIDSFKPHLAFYKDYTRGRRGFRDVVARDPDVVYKALEEQGYESFNHGDFSREDFVLLLADIIRDRSVPYNKYAPIRILKSLVDFSSSDAGPFSQEDFNKLLLVALANGFGNVEDIIETLHEVYYVEDEDGDVEFDEEYVKALISALSNATTFEVETILDELMLYIDEDEVDYSVSDISFQEEGTEYLEINKYAHEIKILDQPVFEWIRMVEYEIHDPISFYGSVTDYKEHGDEFAAPDEASALLDYFEMEEEEPDDPDEPDHPVPDEEGEYAVLYTKYGYDWRNDQILDDIEEQIVVPYSSESDLTDAISLSKTLFYNQGSDHKQWVMTRLIRREKPEVDPRQLEFDIAEYEPEPDPIWSEWDLLDEDEDEDEE